MSGKHHRPDAELQLMQRVMRELASLPPAGRSRVLTYWFSRAAELPDVPSDPNGPQQLDIEDRAMPFVRSPGVAA